MGSIDQPTLPTPPLSHGAAGPLSRRRKGGVGFARGPVLKGGLDVRFSL